MKTPKKCDEIKKKRLFWIKEQILAETRKDKDFEEVAKEEFQRLDRVYQRQ